jgi:hypothetical protein
MPPLPSFLQESHYFNGIFGRTHAASRGLYSTFFPTVLTRWWAERVRGVDKVRRQPARALPLPCPALPHAWPDHRSVLAPQISPLVPPPPPPRAVDVL